MSCACLSLVVLFCLRSLGKYFGDGRASIVIDGVAGYADECGECMRVRCVRYVEIGVVCGRD